MYKECEKQMKTHEKWKTKIQNKYLQKKKNVTKTVQGYSQKWITNTICNPLRSFIHFKQNSF